MNWLSSLVASVVVTTSLGAAAETVEVSQKGRRFLPDSVELKVGDTLKVHNDDEFLHHVYVASPDFNFDSEEQPPGNNVEIKFTHAGEYNVQCRIHPKMKLAVHVTQ